jgi:hypothetical protein
MASSSHYGITVCPRLNTHRSYIRRSHGWVWLALGIASGGVVWSLSPNLLSVVQAFVFIG